MLQASILDCDAFDPFSFAQDFLTRVRNRRLRGEIVQALVIAAMIVMIDEGGDLRFQVSGQIIVFEQDAVFERLMPALDLTPCLRMTRRAANVFDVAVAEPFREIAGEPLSESRRGRSTTWA